MAHRNPPRRHSFLPPLSGRRNGPTIRRSTPQTARDHFGILRGQFSERCARSNRNAARDDLGIRTLRHAERAIADGVDGLVLLSAGSGGNTGWLNPFAFVRAVRSFWDGPLVLAGGAIDGVSLKAMQTLGCDLGYAGTRMIAATESLADNGYRAMLAASTMDDVLLTKAFTGLETNMLRPSIEACGLDPENLGAALDADRAPDVYNSEAAPRRWKDIWSAGHTVSGVKYPQSVAEVVKELIAEFEQS